MTKNRQILIKIKQNLQYSMKQKIPLLFSSLDPISWKGNYTEHSLEK